MRFFFYLQILNKRYSPLVYSWFAQITKDHFRVTIPTIVSSAVKTTHTDDYVEVRDGEFDWQVWWKKVINSSYKYLFVEFVGDSDYSPSTRKFQAKYRAVTLGN